MPVDPDCDTGDCGDEPPDADPGCCGALTCEENETCCNNTTCVLTSSFQTDSNNCGGCGNVCPPGYHCESGTCVSDGGGTMGCCRTYTCTAHPDNPSLPYNFDLTSTVSTNEDCSTGDSTCCFDIPGMHPACVGSTYSIWSSEPCPSFRSLMSNGEEIIEEDKPCVEGECEAHVSTWMAEPSGEPNEEGLYKVKWVLLDGCPGLCCSDQPTQPEFVKSSTLVDAPCKCGCN